MGKVDYSEHASLVNPLNGPARSACQPDDAGSLCGEKKESNETELKAAEKKENR